MVGWWAGGLVGGLRRILIETNKMVEGKNGSDISISVKNLSFRYPGIGKC